MLFVSRRARVVSVTVLGTNLVIATLHNNFDTLIFSGLVCTLNRLLLCVEEFCVTLIKIAKVLDVDVKELL